MNPPYSLKGFFGRPGNQGFTLIEFLLAATIFSLVITSSYTIFWAGIRIWKFTRVRGVAEKKAVFAMEKIGRDLRTMIRIPETDPKGRGRGDARALQIPSLVRVPMAGRGIEMRQWGFIVYRWNPSTRVLCRGEWTATDLFRGTPAPCAELARSIADFRLRYLIDSGVGGNYSWYDAWDETGPPPMAVEIQLEMEPLMPGEKEPMERRYRQTVFIAAGETIREPPVLNSEETTEGPAAMAAQAAPSL